MDRVALAILTTELERDSTVLAEAARLARERLRVPHPGHLEACGYELNRLYNVVEKAFERVCMAFENHFDKRGDYHERLIERVSLEIAEVRPAFLPAAERQAVRELKSFRHLFQHVYDLHFREDRLGELVTLAEHVAVAFPVWVRDFSGKVRAELEG